MCFYYSMNKSHNCLCIFLGLHIYIAFSNGSQIMGDFANLQCVMTRIIWTVKGVTLFQPQEWAATAPG